MRLPSLRTMSSFALAGILALGASFVAAEDARPAAPSAGEAAPAATPAPTPTPAPATPAAPVAPKSGFEAWNQKSKQPYSWWKWGADLRLRDEFMNDTLTLNSNADRHEQNYGRFRARWWNTFTPAKGLDLNVRLTIESRYWTEPSYSSPFHKGWDWNEVVFDYLNARWKGGKDVPVTVQVGRQDLSFGDNWLIFEGTPLDGSRTINFDVARATFEVKKWKTTFDAILVDQWARNDHYVPPIKIASDVVNGVTLPIKKAQVEQNERGLILYASNKSRAKTQIDGYFIYKGDRREPIRVAAGAKPTCAPYVISDTPDDANMVKNLCAGNQGDLYTVGSRVAGEITPIWRYRAEAAFQAGNRMDRDQRDLKRDVRALGFNGALTFAPKTKLGHQLRVAYEFLSGGKPGTGTDGQFDILWGRWPRWSELYIYTYAPETRISQLSNLHRVGPGWSFKPFAKGELVTDVNWLFAAQNNRPVGFFSASGKTRGTLFTSKLLLKLTPHLSGHVWAEHFRPGSYYAEARRDPATFIRTEMILAW